MRPFALCLAQTGLALALCASAPRAGRAQQPMVEYTCNNLQVLSVHDLEALDKAVKLSAAQKASVESLMRSALTRCHVVQARRDRAVRERMQELLLDRDGERETPEARRDRRAEQMKSAMAMWRELAAVEREALVDVRAALTEKQVDEGWAAFERARRRVLLNPAEWYGQPGPLGANPRDVLRRAGVTEADTAAVEPVLARYETELDALLLARMRAIDEVNRRVAATGVEEDNARSGPEFKSAEIRRLNTSTAARIEPLLSEEGRRLFLRARIGLEQERSFFPPRWDPDVSSALRVKTLSDEQRSQIEALIAKADGAVFALAVQALHDIDDAVLRDGAMDPQEGKATDAQRKAGVITRELAGKVRALLSPAQLDEADAARVSGAEDGRDEFKLDYTPQFDSLWLRKPEPPARPATK